jgi:hypothetical protein
MRLTADGVEGDGLVEVGVGFGVVVDVFGSGDEGPHLDPVLDQLPKVSVRSGGSGMAIVVNYCK